MAGRSRTTVDPLLKSYIEEEARNDRKASWRQIAARVRKHHTDVKDKPMPKERAIQTIANNARKRPGPSPDDPWNLGVSSPLIPPEATGDLLAVWKRCLKEGRRLSVREAIWVARLRSALPGAEPGFLLQWAGLYSGRERSTRGDNPLDTADLDAEIAFQPWQSSFHSWEYDTAVLTGTVLPSKSGPILGEGYVSKAADPNRPSRYILNFARMFLTEVGGPEIDKCPWWEQAESITAFWLDVISAKVPKWQNVDLGHFEEPGARQEWEDKGRRLARWVVGAAQTLEEVEDLLSRRKGPPQVDKEKAKARVEQSAHESEEATDSAVDRWFAKSAIGEVGISREQRRELVTEIGETLQANLTKAKPWRPIQVLKEVGL